MRPIGSNFNGSNSDLLASILSGKKIKIESGLGGELHIQQIGERFVDQIVYFRKTIIENLEQRDFLFPEPDEHDFVQKSLTRDFALGILTDRRVLGYSVISVDMNECEFKAGIGTIPSVVDYKNASILKVTMIAPQLRGIGLQNLLIDLRMKFAAMHNKSDIFVITSKRNWRSIDNLFSRGFRPIGVRTFYDSNLGELRRIVHHAGSTTCPIIEKRKLAFALRDS